VRVFLLLIVLGVLVLFVLQNMTPALSLTILGMQTLALPLAVWILGAIAAGAITALLTGALIRLGGGRPSRRRSSGSRPRRGDTADTPWTPPPWTGRSAEPRDTPPPPPKATYRGNDDDWGGSADSDDWDEWARSQESAPSKPVRSAPTPPIRDAEFRPLNVETVYPEPEYEPTYSDTYRANANSYDGSGDRAPYGAPDFDSPRYDGPTYGGFGYEEPDDKEQEVWDDWEEAEPVRSQPPSPPPEETPPARDIVEIHRVPRTAERTGTIYSYSYRSETEEAETPDADPATAAVTADEPPPGEIPSTVESQEETADAVISAPIAEEEPRVRIIIPPYRPPVAAPPPEPVTDWAEAEDEEDLDEEDLDEEDLDEEDKTLDMTGDREVWDDWEEDSDEPDTPPGNGPSPRSPNSNPPLQF